MKPEFHNLRRRFDARGVWVLAPALLALLVSVGVTTPHAVELASLTAAAERASADALDCMRLRSGVQAFEAAGGSERARAAILLGRSVLPSDCSTAELHSAVRLGAAESGWALKTLGVGEPAALELFGGEPPIFRRNVELSGHAAISSLPRLVRALAARGYPARVVSLTLTQEQRDSREFEIHAMLAMFHVVSGTTIVAPSASRAEEER